MVGVIIQIPLICVETPSRFVSTPGFVEEYPPRTHFFRQPASGVVVFYLRYPYAHPSTPYTVHQPRR
jgi:hypothetical protein